MKELVLDIAKAIRTVIRSAANREDKKVSLEIV